MNKLFCLIAIVFNLTIAKAELSNIVALVNSEPITLHEFLARKHMIITLNNINNRDHQIDKHLNKMVINDLIEDVLLYQSAHDTKSSESELNQSIETIEQRNKMTKGQLIQFLRSKSVDINSFKSKIRAEIIKINILSNISKSIAVSAEEVNTIILANNSKDAEISAQIFTSKNKDDKTLQKMYSLQKGIKNCYNVKESLYKSFATLETINQNLSTLDPRLQIILKDLYAGEKSSVFEMQDALKLILMCNKKIIDITPDENSYVINLLTNKKISQKAQQYFENMRKKAYIKVMIPL